MTNQERQEKKEQLNQLGIWYCLEKEKGFPDKNIKLELRIKMEELLLELFTGKIPNTSYRCEEILGELFDEILEKFDSTKKNLYQFTKKRLKYRAIDLYRKDFEIKKGKTPQEDGSTKEEWRSRTISLETPIDGNNEMMLGDTLESKHHIEEDFEEQNCIEVICSDLIMLMVELPERLHGRQRNPVRINYYRMFYTETVVKLLHGFSVEEVCERRERDLFEHSMQLKFLDFFMLNQYRTVRELQKGHLKPYGELVDRELPEEKRMAETEFPLKQDVYVSYMNRVEGKSVADSTLSEHYKSYLEFIGQIKPTK